NQSRPFNFGELPLSLTTMSIDVKDNWTIQPGTLPSSLVSLTLLPDFERFLDPNVPILIPGSLPGSLETLSLQGSIIERLKPGLLPSSLKSLKLDDLRVPPTLGDIPSSIISLEFGSDFNHPLGVGVLPSSLQTLHFGYTFNQQFLPGVFPRSLKSLYFDEGLFNQSFGLDVLPPHLTTLSLLSRFNKTIIPGSLPNSLVTLQFGKIYGTIDLDVLPTSLTSLTYEFKGTFSLRYSFELYTYSLLVSWPPSLQTMVVGDLWRFNYHEPIPIPPSVTSLSIQLVQQEHLRLLSKSLTYLDLGHTFNSPITQGSLPPSLVHLIIGNAFNQVLPTGVLPATLTDLSLGDTFNQALPIGVLPPSLKSLGLGRHFKQGLKQTSLPGTLRTLSVDSRGQTKYVTLPTSSFKSDLDLLEVRTGFFWTNMATKNKASSIKLLRIKQYKRTYERSQAHIIGPMVVSFPNVHTFDVTFHIHRSKDSLDFDLPLKLPIDCDLLYRIQVRRIHHQLAICLIYNHHYLIKDPKFCLRILDLSRYDGSRPSCPSPAIHTFN
ncbi:hypothetical protein SAMD00019534_115000, partial [Acytostelium subglobosum LB1]|uniref:hypothetical protein n=1 Tax=Acytostelium subglobosum LB1 TaxID=1410327 RepID=UPI000644D049